MFDLNERIAVSASRPKATAAAPDASRPEAVAALAVRLGQLPALTFERALIGGGAEGAAPSTRTFGSVTADDVVVALQSEHGVELPGGRSSVRVDGGRIKDVGTHAVHINVGDGGEVVLTVVVRAPKGDE
ncbi:hypothetical protein HK405_003823 [Cladochytrium tenue]|nr:hypothetical protein HK405_003823 [Cladochytrium tenue]